MADMPHSVPLSRTEWVARQLRSDILKGVFPPGTKLLANELAKRYGVSATPLREAIQQLAADGLVRATPQRGARVSGLDLAEALELYELRLQLEPGAMRRSIRQAPETRLLQIGQAYQELEGRPVDEDYFQVHNRFHRLMRMDCPSTWMLRIVDQLTVNCERYRRLREVDDAVVSEHQALATACMARDHRSAAQLMRAHIATTRDHIRRALAAGEPHVPG